MSPSSNAERSLESVERAVLTALEMVEQTLGRQMRAITAQLSEMQRETARMRTELTHLATRAGADRAKVEAVVDGKGGDVKMLSEVAAMESAVLRSNGDDERKGRGRASKRKLVQLDGNAEKAVAAETGRGGSGTRGKRAEAQPRASSKAKRDEDFLVGELTQDEQLLVATGRGRRGEVLSTPLGYAYWTKDENETLMSVGTKINVEPLTLYSMNRWQLKLKQFRLNDEFHPNTRLWIVPHEDWEHQYIKEDRGVVLQELLKTISDVWPDYVTSQAPLRKIRPRDLPSYESSSRFYNEIRETLSAAEAAARAKTDAEKLRDLEIIRQEFDRKWLRDGFLPPEQIAQRE